jgi:hypothetical protein
VARRVPRDLIPVFPVDYGTVLMSPGSSVCFCRRVSDYGV